ncbi:MAG: phosphate ABC transporter substrate-binding protein [Armatimonadaceae bacterium]
MRFSFFTSSSSRIAAAAALLGMLMPLMGCNPPAPEGDAAPTGAAMTSETGTGEAPTSTAGRLVIEGSDTVLPLSQKWADEFKKKNPSADITVSGGGSGQGITSLLNGTTDIANASRPAKDEEKEKAKEKGFELYETAVARDGITIVVHPTNPVKSLTVEQLARIYAGQVRNWKDVGGPDLPITTNGRDTSSGTYAFFQEDVLAKLGKETKYRTDMSTNPSNNKIAENVASQKGGIGYIGVAYASEFTEAGKVKEVPIAFAEGQEALLPTSENVMSGKYPISRALFNYTRNAPEGTAKEYLDYVTSPEGQEIVKAEGYIALK